MRHILLVASIGLRNIDVVVALALGFQHDELSIRGPSWRVAMCSVGERLLITPICIHQPNLPTAAHIRAKRYLTIIRRPSSSIIPHGIVRQLALTTAVGVDGINLRCLGLRTLLRDERKLCTVVRPFNEVVATIIVCKLPRISTVRIQDIQLVLRVLRVE